MKYVPNHELHYHRLNTQVWGIRQVINIVQYLKSLLLNDKSSCGCVHLSSLHGANNASPRTIGQLVTKFLNNLLI